jgi:hypothetical protein
MAWTFPLGGIFPVSARCRAGQPKQPPQHGFAIYGHKFEATEALTPGVLVQRLFDATLGGCSLSLGIVDRRFGQLGGPISGCDCV